MAESPLATIARMIVLWEFLKSRVPVGDVNDTKCAEMDDLLADLSIAIPALSAPGKANWTAVTSVADAAVLWHQTGEESTLHEVVARYLGE